MSGVRTVYVTTADHVELRPPLKGWAALEIVNDDAAEILYAEGTMATPENGLPIAANGSKAWSADGTKAAVPSGSVWLLGSTAGRQKVFIRETAAK